jgi:hypothetical protein
LSSEDKNGNTNTFDCLIPAKDNSYLDITFNIITLNAEKQIISKFLNAKIGNNLLLYGVDLDKSEGSLPKKILIKIKNQKLFDSKQKAVC